jgi:hypothetical protein
MNESLKNLIKEPSTWRGIAALITAAGIAVSPEQIAVIAVAGFTVIGLIGAIFKDKQ